jgi:hypothetical protein
MMDDNVRRFRLDLVRVLKRADAWEAASPTAKSVALTMVMRHANPQRSGAMFPAQSRVASYFETKRRGATASATGHLSRRTVIRALAQLVELGLFTRERLPGVTTNVYRVNPVLSSRSATVGVEDVTADVTSDVTQKEVLRTSEQGIAEEGTSSKFQDANEVLFSFGESDISTHIASPTREVHPERAAEIAAEIERRNQRSEARRAARSATIPWGVPVGGSR